MTTAPTSRDAIQEALSKIIGLAEEIDDDELVEECLRLMDKRARKLIAEGVNQ